MSERVRLRVRTDPSLDSRRFPQGKDTFVECVSEDGTSRLIEGITSISIRVDARAKHISMALEGDFYIDVQGMLVPKPEEPKGIIIHVWDPEQSDVCGVYCGADTLRLSEMATDRETVFDERSALAYVTKLAICVDCARAVKP